MPDTPVYSVPESLRMLARASIHAAFSNTSKVLDWYFERTSEAAGQMAYFALDLRDMANDAQRGSTRVMRDLAQDTTHIAEGNTTPARKPRATRTRRTKAVAATA